MSAEDATDRFRLLFAETERELLAYALRRVDRAEDAADVVAETFLVAWRRLDRVPPGDEARLWLYGVARRQLANQRRGQLRRSRLADRLRAELPAAVASASIPEDHRVAAVHAALARLDEEDREILRLTSWEGLTPSEIAAVLGVPGVTVRSRLHRARKRLRLRAFKALLATLERVDTDRWLSAMPASAIKTTDRDTVVARMLQGVTVPPGFGAADIKGANLTKDRYQLGAAVTGTVACRRFRRWSDARLANDAVKERKAVAAMATAKHWPILEEMANEGLGCDVLGVDLG